MIIHDYECRDCGNINETFITDTRFIPKIGVCPDCGGQTRRIVSISSTVPVDADWINSVLEVVDKDSDKPHCKEFLRHPTRANYKAWMRGEGLRPLEPGEKPARPDKESRRQRIREQLHKRYREREAITL